MKAFLGLALLLATHSSWGQIRSFSLSGNFENSSGCRVFGASCVVFEGYNTCQFEVYQNGEYVTSLGKAAKVVSFSEGQISARDFGLRSTTIGVPSYVNVKARMKITGTYRDPDNATDLQVSKFDLVVTEGTMNQKVIECKNLKLSY